MKFGVYDPAPPFSAPDQNGQVHTLEEYKGKWLLLFFYPKDDTPGCTKEACGFRDAIQDLKSRGVEVIGISADNQESHSKFIEKYGLPFTLLSDPERTVIEAYGANGLLYPKRVSFLISPEQKITKMYPKVDSESHAEEVVADVDALTEEVKMD